MAPGCDVFQRDRGFCGQASTFEPCFPLSLNFSMSGFGESQGNGREYREKQPGHPAGHIGKQVSCNSCEQARNARNMKKNVPA